MTNSPTPDTFSALVAAHLSASLTVTDIHRSLTWYTGVLGFGVDRRHERDGKLLAVSLIAGSIRILLTQDNGARGADRMLGDGFSLQLSTRQDIDAIANRIKVAGGTLASEPADVMGARAFRLADPDGFKFVISSVREGW
jgi:catechol 2,3-dioxygenase-like lactoylglutathione lyase family enzyme